MRALTRDEFMRKVRHDLRLKRIKGIKLIKSEAVKCFYRKNKKVLSCANSLAPIAIHSSEL